jgi:hypothetical protein
MGTGNTQDETRASCSARKCPQNKNPSKLQIHIDGAYQKNSGIDKKNSQEPNLGQFQLQINNLTLY